MIAYLSGSISYKSPTYIYMDINGVGYHVNISLHTYGALEEKETIKLWTHLVVKEDSHTLYGFFTQEERSLFVHLISVSGIGPNTARLILSSLTTSEAKLAIANEAVATFNKVKGVGPKTAKRIILDLKEKIIKEGIEPDTNQGAVSNEVSLEATSALMALGFQKAQIKRKIDQHYLPNMNVEDLIKQVLQSMNK